MPVLTYNLVFWKGVLLPNATYQKEPSLVFEQINVLL